MGLALGVPPFFFLPNRFVVDGRMASGVVGVDGVKAHDDEMQVRQISADMAIVALEASLDREDLAMVEFQTEREPL